MNPVARIPRWLVPIAMTTMTVLVSLDGQAEDGPEWVFDRPEFVSSDRLISVRLPDRWLRTDVSGDRFAFVMATRDGPTLQVITCLRIPGREFAKSYEGAPLRSLTPEEIAAVLISQKSRAEETRNVKVVENRPYSLAGHAGFRILMEYYRYGAIEFRSLMYGAFDGNGLYLLSYEAPTIYYFERDLERFEATVESLETG